MFRRIAVTLPIALSLIALSLMAAPTLSLAGAQAGAQVGDRTTEEVLNHHLESFGAGNIDEIMSGYTEESVVIVPGGVLKGKEQINGLYDALIAEFSKPGLQFELTDSKLDGPMAYITWKAETQDNVYSFATDTFIITDGKIAYQTVAFVVTPKG
jgi:hypothetical protein